MADEPRWRANHAVSAAQGVGGHLSVEDGRLVFAPNAIDRKLAGGREWSVALADITAVAVSPRRWSHAWSGGARRRLSVTAGGEEALFVVSRPDRVAAALNELRAA
jgi:hypothetical protein